MRKQRTPLTPTETYEEACGRLGVQDMVNWIWQHRVRNSLAQARQRKLKQCKINIAERHGVRLTRKDNIVVLGVHKKLIETGYCYTPDSYGDNEKVKAQVIISPLWPAESEPPQTPETSK